MAKQQKSWKEIAAERQAAKQRKEMDQRLERAGLMNYQTQGMSQQQIAQRYQQAGIQVQDKWFNENYGGNGNAPQYAPQTQEKTPPAWYSQAHRPGTTVQVPQGGQSPALFLPPKVNTSTQPQAPVFQPSNLPTGTNLPATSTNPMIARYNAGYEDAANAQYKTVVDLYKPGYEGAATVKDAVSGQANWTDVSVDQRKKVLTDPNFYKTNQINQYPKWMQQQILADPNFDWKKLPKWQEMYYKLSSSPTAMGAAQGLVMGAGNPGGAVVGGALGYVAAKSGYDPMKEAWKQDNVTAGAFGWMNFMAEQAEKAVGIGVQAVGAMADKNPDTKIKDVFTKEAWDAGAVTFETLAPAYKAAINDGKGTFELRDLLKVAPPIWVASRITDLMLHPDKYKGEEIILGADDPLQLDSTFQERITEARTRIKQGENYREVALDFQNGIMGQLGDMVGQGIADPLNVMPQAETKILGKVAEVTGNKVAAEAFNTSNAPMEAAAKYKNLVQTGEALKINPEFKVDQMGWMSRMVAGVNKEGQIKAGAFTNAGMLDAPSMQPKKNIKGFVQEMTSLTPQSRAQIGAGMFYENIGALLTRFDDPHEAGKYLKALAGSDMNTWKELGSRFAESPEFYTVLPALKDFNASGLDGVIAAWDSTQMNRDTLTRVADVLGENPSKLLDDLASRGTADQDFQRIQQKLEASQAPEAKALLGEIQAGRFNADSLKSMVDVFTGDGAVPWHPNQVKALMLDALGSHFDEWVSKRLMLDQTPEAKSAFFRTAAVLKGAQSILLLGASPGYAIQNGLSNMVHRAATGIYGYLTPNQINGFMDRMGISPARFDEGVGIGGMVEQAAGSSKVKTDAITKAVKGKGPLTDMKQKISDVSGKMPFSKLSSWFEKSEGRQAFSIAMKQFWSQSWRRGTGFKQMSPELVGAIKSMGIDPNRIYSAIEAGMNQGEIEKALYGRFEGVQSRSLIDDAAKKTGLTASQAADMLDKVGVLDVLDSYLKGQTTRDGVSAAFKRAERVAQDYLDMQTGEDLKGIAEHVKQKVAIEQPAAAFEVIQKANNTFTDTWMEHYYRFGEVMNDLTLLDDPAMKSKAIENAYSISDAEFRRVYARNAANYQGIFEAWGRSGNPDALGALAAMGEIDTSMKQAYDFMRQSRKEFFDKYRNDFDNPARMDEWDKNQRSIDQAFKQAFKQKHDAEVKAGKSLGNIFEGLYGKAAGEAARLWWEDVVKFNDEIVKREQKARADFAQLPKEQREAAKQKYYSETKILLINEAAQINEQGLARLERVIKRGDGGGTQARQPTPPTEPTPTPAVSDQPLAVRSEPTPAPAEAVRTEATRPATKPSPADEINNLIQQAEQRAAADAQAQAQRVASVWDVAEEYGRMSLPYDRTILQDRFALIAALRKPEYGGMADLTGLNDPRLTPEFVRDVMEARQAAKDAEGAAKLTQAIVNAEEAGSNARIPKINQNTTILRAISEHGGLSVEQALTLTGEKRPKTAPGVFTKKGTNIDDMARMLADDGYPIDLNDPTDPGGIQQTTALIERARRGDKVYPMGHDHEAAIARAQDEAAVRAFEEAVSNEQLAEPFDAALWQKDFADTVESADLSRMYELIGELPEDVGSTPRAEGSSETWNDYVSRMADETAARVEADARDLSIAESMTRADEAMYAGEVRAEYASTRNLLKEKFTEVFDLSEDQATAYMELSDALSGWYERVTGESGEAFYNRYYNDVVGDQPLAVSGERLEQVDVNRRMSQQEIDQYARALVREGSAELRRAIKNENVKADRVAILDAAYRLNPEMAVSVAKQSTDVLFQNGQFTPTNAKGAVTFDADGIKATIHAFESKDFSTLVHENAHVFRRMLNDVATRTDNAKVKADLATIEEWAGVKDGVWDRTAEEKFARGFERYVTEGDAPTPKLKAAFESFKGWMLQIYKQITGSAIDVKLTDEVRAVFDRMLGGEERAAVSGQQLAEPNARYDAEAMTRDLMSRLDNDMNYAKEKGMTPYYFVKRDMGGGRSEYQAVSLDGEVLATGSITGLGDKLARRKANYYRLNDAFVEAKAKDVVTRDLVEGQFREAMQGQAEFNRRTDAERTQWEADKPQREVQMKNEAERNARAQDAYVRLINAKEGQIIKNADGENYRVVKNTNRTNDQIAAMAPGRQSIQYKDTNGRTRHVVFEKYAGELPTFGNDARVQENLAKVKGGQPTAGEALFQRAEPVDTPEFKRWFGESKVVDENGRPLVVYHGTSADFQTFDRSRAGSQTDTGAFGEGFYITSPRYASTYARGQGGNVLPVYLSIEKPYVINTKSDIPNIEVSLRTIDEMKNAARTYSMKMRENLIANGYDGVVIKLDKSQTEYVAFEPTQIKSTANRGTFDPDNPNILFQDNTQPVGALDAASQFLPQSEPMDQGWSQYVKPLLGAMEEGAINQLGDKPLDGAVRDMSPEGQKMLRQYMNGVKNDMASTKLATLRWGEQKRDFAMLNYNKRYGFDRWLDVVYPYQFFYSRSLATWAARALDTPAWYSNYARLKMQQQRYERDIPERLRNKLKIPAPWLPDWAGDSLYIDPIGSLFTPANFLRPFERMQSDKNQQQIEAERILQEWAADGTVSQADIQQAAQSQSGSAWERALAEAKIRRESEIANPMDFFSTMFGPAWYLSTPLNLAGIKVPGLSKGDPNKVTGTPLSNTARAIDTVTQGSWAEPIGDLIGMIGKPEEWARQKLGLPTMGEYGEYYTKRQVANMVAEGKITSEQATIAMLEKKGPLWDEASERVKMELALRVPTMGALYAGLHGKGIGGGLKDAAAAFLPSLFGSGLLPQGELEYRGLKQEWNEVWKRYDAGDKQAVTGFFDEHPEYEAYLAKGKDDGELMKSFLIGQIWDGYMALGVTNQKQAKAEMGEMFAQAFLNKETRSYESIDTETLTQWAQMLNKMVPNVQQSAVSGQQLAGQTPPVPQLNLYDPAVTKVTDEFFTQRTKNFGNYYELEQGYYNLPKSQRSSYLMKNPELKQYWDWKKSWEKAYPELVPIMKGQVFKRVDTSTWVPGLVEYVTDYAYGGGKLPKGAYKALEQVWIMEGRPLDDLNAWLNSTVVPAMLYGDQPAP